MAEQVSSALQGLLLHRSNWVSSWGINSSWISVLFATCISPLVFSLFNLHMVQHLQNKVVGYFRRWLQSYEEVLVREDQGVLKNDLLNFVSDHLRNISENVCGARIACSLAPTYGVHFELQPTVIIQDTYENAEVAWQEIVEREGKSSHRRSSSRNSDQRLFRMTIRKQPGVNTMDIAKRYMQHIVDRGLELQNSRRERNIYNFTPGGYSWNRPVPFHHPFTFNNLALPTETRNMVLTDLNNFSAGKDFYARVGKPWKRGYLLYGPPGTGKSSLIAAISEHLKYDIYDLDLAAVRNNATLRNLMVATSRRSVIVIEDIDCTIDLSKRSNNKGQITQKQGPANFRSAVTLSGMLNFCDGLWSGSGDERIFIFTTNHVEKLDPALLRKGRMDLHLCLDYCRFEAFKMLMKNYLGIENHQLLPEINRLIESAYATPADIGEVLLSFRDDPDVALTNVIELLNLKLEAPHNKDDDENLDEEDAYVDENFGEDGEGDYGEGGRRRYFEDIRGRHGDGDEEYNGQSGSEEEYVEDEDGEEYSY